GTSYASRTARAVFKKSKFPFGISLPTWLGRLHPVDSQTCYGS
ncbi:membrane protein, partial [Salmonella enterica subsp. enterica serovar Urbana str. R8-2977]